MNSKSLYSPSHSFHLSSFIFHISPRWCYTRYGMIPSSFILLRCATIHGSHQLDPIQPTSQNHKSWLGESTFSRLLHIIPFIIQNQHRSPRLAFIDLRLARPPSADLITILPCSAPAPAPRYIGTNMHTYIQRWGSIHENPL